MGYINSTTQQAAIIRSLVSKYFIDLKLNLVTLIILKIKSSSRNLQNYKVWRSKICHRSTYEGMKEGCQEVNKATHIKKYLLYIPQWVEKGCQSIEQIL